MSTARRIRCPSTPTIERRVSPVILRLRPGRLTMTRICTRRSIPGSQRSQWTANSIPRRRRSTSTTVKLHLPAARRQRSSNCRSMSTWPERTPRSKPVRRTKTRLRATRFLTSLAKKRRTGWGATPSPRTMVRLSRSRIPGAIRFLPPACRTRKAASRAAMSKTWARPVEKPPILRQRQP